MQDPDLVQQLMMEEDRSAMSVFLAYSDDRSEASFNLSVWLKCGFIPKHIKQYCGEELYKRHRAVPVQAAPARPAAHRSRAAGVALDKPRSA